MADRCDIGFKQKAVIEFHAFEGNAAKEISDRLKNVYGDSALSYASVKRWVTRFKSGGSSITDKPRFGRPSTAVTEENRVLVVELIRSDRRIMGGFSGGGRSGQSPPQRGNFFFF